ncbi:5500_t:CDS:1 [Entrophospora sp. SA101]|nr:5500_t:CDS:1 [Entrophospora sp. SA101]
MSLLQVVLYNVSHFIFFWIYASRGYYESYKYLFVFIPTVLMFLCATGKCLHVIKSSKVEKKDKTNETIEAIETMKKNAIKYIISRQFYQSLMLLIFVGDIIAMLLLNLDPIWTKVYLTTSAVSFVLGGIAINAGEKKVEKDTMNEKDSNMEEKRVGMKD